nr:MAG TPA: Protein of unknown function (DUF4236) [Caudoviricetes sp.]
MAFKLRKRVKIAPGVNINVSKKGVSATLGGKGASVNVGQNGTYLNTSIPGTGLYNRQKLGNAPESNTQNEPNFTPPPAFIDFGAESWKELTLGNKIGYAFTFLVWLIANFFVSVIKVTSGIWTLFKLALGVGFWALICYIMYKLFW